LENFVNLRLRSKSLYYLLQHEVMGNRVLWKKGWSSQTISNTLPCTYIFKTANNELRELNASKTVSTRNVYNVSNGFHFELLFFPVDCLLTSLSIRTDLNILTNYW